MKDFGSCVSYKGKERVEELLPGSQVIQSLAYEDRPVPSAMQ